MAAVEDKLSDELDLSRILKKIRNSYDLLRHVLSDYELNYLKFNKDRILNFTSDESEKEEEQDPTITPLRVELRASIIKGMDIDQEYKRDLLILNRKNDANHFWNPPPRQTLNE